MEQRPREAARAASHHRALGFARRGRQLSLGRPSNPSSQAAPGCGLWTGREGRRRWRQLSSLLPPLPRGWAAGHEISSRRWGRGVTIQSTCHPHSQAASSSLLTNEGGGVGEADTEGGGRRGQTRRCEKRGREAKRKAQCGAEAAGSDRPEGQRARGQRARLEPRLREAGRQQKQAQ